MKPVWEIIYVVGNTYRRKFVEANSADEAVKKGRVKNIVELFKVR